MALHKLILVTLLLCCVIWHRCLTHVAAVKQKSGNSNDLTSMLSFFQTPSRDSPVTSRSSPDKSASESGSAAGGSSGSAARGGSGKRKRNRSKCKCQRQASRRLRREIKDVTFRSCHSQSEKFYCWLCVWRKVYHSLNFLTTLVFTFLQIFR